MLIPYLGEKKNCNMISINFGAANSKIRGLGLGLWYLRRMDRISKKELSMYDLG